MKTVRLAIFVSALCLVWTGVVSAQTMTLQNYDQASIPLNKESATYPTYYDSETEGGIFTITVDSEHNPSVTSGTSALIDKNSASDQLYAQFNPYDGSSRDFTRVYAACGYPSACGDASDWQMNTYTKMRFWLKVPANSGMPNYATSFNNNVGLYVKQITNADPYSDEAGGDHFYHGFNTEPTGTWWQVILPMHPNHARGVDHVDPGYIPYITSTNGDDPPNTYNYWDTLTRWYIQCETVGDPYKLDDIVFYADPYPEDDVHLSSAILATYVASSNRVIVNWSRQIQDTDLWDVKYAFSDIHVLGWANATTAPGSPLSPSGEDDYVNMHYDTASIDVTGHPTLYIAVRSQLSSTVFNQIAISTSEAGTTGNMTIRRVRQ